MTTEPSRLHDDLVYVRELAEGGQAAPLLGGRFLVWWGALVTLAWAVHYGTVSGLLGLKPQWLSALWFGWIIVAVGGQIVLSRLMPRNKPGASSAGNRAERTVWAPTGFVFFAFFMGLLVRSLLVPGASPGDVDWSVPMAFGLYGVALITSGQMGRARALTWAGIVSIAMVGVACVLVGRSELWAAAAAGAFLTVFLPGLFLLRSEPSGVV